jgi:hypothetical protein
MKVNLRKLVLAAGTALIGLSAQGALAQSVTMAVAAPVTSLDPHYHQLSPNNAVADIIFDKLVNTDAKSNNLPGLALSWRAVEPNVWEFKLRPNVRFHNGSEFTAEDVAFTLQRLPKPLPMALVKELAYTGRRLSADKALAHGLVNEVLPTHEATVAAALQAAKEIASKPPVAIWGTKQVLHYARDHSTEDSLRHMGWLQGAIWSNANVREAISAMQQKREANYAPLPALKGFREFG